MSRLIKRYNNRKLYDTLARRYITLDGLSELIRQGEELQVVDFASGGDLTAATLAQIISGQEKHRRGGFPGPVLAGLLQAGETTADQIRQVFHWMGDVNGEIRRRVEWLVEEGKLSPEDGDRWMELLLTAEKAAAPSPVEEIVGRLLAERGVPTRQEILRLSEQIDALTAKLHKR